MSRNPLQKALKLSLQAISHDTSPRTTLPQPEQDLEALSKASPSSFSIYHPLLLLPAHAFNSPEWTSLLSPLSANARIKFFATLAHEMKVTHIALNAPISPTENIQRRPSITPLHGDFGTFVTTEDPEPRDLETAQWVTAKQNGITQVFAPLYSMFSKGNITEKTRILTLDSVSAAAREEGGCTAVDLYAGIGYFAFSYAKAGCKVVLGWELNRWSVEGLRRGAVVNGWGVAVVRESQRHDIDVGKRITVFCGDNAGAAKIVERNRGRLPPVRHVSLGLLPSSEAAWETGVRVLDGRLGGWLHVHENIAIGDIEERSTRIVRKLRNIVGEVRGDEWTADLDHVERVKTYAPGVMHCVLDVRVWCCKDDMEKDISTVEPG